MIPELKILVLGEDIDPTFEVFLQSGDESQVGIRALNGQAYDFVPMVDGWVEFQTVHSGNEACLLRLPSSVIVGIEERPAPRNPKTGRQQVRMLVKAPFVPLMNDPVQVTIVVPKGAKVAVSEDRCITMMRETATELVSSLKSEEAAQAPVEVPVEVPSQGSTSNGSNGRKTRSRKDRKTPKVPAPQEPGTDVSPPFTNGDGVTAGYEDSEEVAALRRAATDSEDPDTGDVEN